MSPCSAATYGMQGRPRPVNTMTLSLKKSPDDLEQKDQYLTPPNAYDRSDFYTHMNPAGPALAPQDPPPQYNKAFYSANVKDQLYSEIPGERLNYEEEDEPQDEYVSSTHRSNTEKEDTLKSDISVQEMYGNL